MNTNAPHEEPSDLLDLGQVTVNFIESLQLLFDELPDQAFGVAVSVVNTLVEALCELEGASTGEGEYDTGEKFHFLN